MLFSGEPLITSENSNNLSVDALDAFFTHNETEKILLTGIVPIISTPLLIELT